MQFETLRRRRAEGCPDEKTLMGQVSSFPLQNLICLRFQLQIDGFTPFTTTVYCTAHIQIVSLVFTKQLYVHAFASVQSHFLSTNTLQKSSLN